HRTVASPPVAPPPYPIVPPPAWRPRAGRAEEQESRRAFMEELLISDVRDRLADRALELGMGLVGGPSGVLFDASGTPVTSRGLDPASVSDLAGHLAGLPPGVSEAMVGGTEELVMAVPVAGLSGSSTLVVLAGPFTPGFGSDEVGRMRQLMSAFVTALDRRHLIVQLEQANAALVDA